jgi:hypothetical protein
MLSPRILAVYVLALVMALCCVPSFAQISNLNFLQLQMNGSAAASKNGNGQKVLRLTPDDSLNRAGSAWWMTQQSVANGFTTVFQFQITHSSDNGPGPADGFAFVVQNAHNYGDAGPLSALGGTSADLGYGSTPNEEGVIPIDNSIAIEFDTFQNSWDPNNNHVAVQSCGTGNNTPEHGLVCTSSQSSTLGITSTPGVNLSDGNVHTVILQYDPGTLSIFVDNNSTPVLVVPLQLATLLSLNAGQTAYVGFTGGTGSSTENNDILTWTFTPGQSGTQTTITQTLTPGPGPNFTNYIFGSYNHKYEYSNANAGDQVSVTAMPSDPAIVNPILQSFGPNTSCIVYDGTGGRCVVFQVSCQQQVGNDCSTLAYTLFESYNTQQTINQPCLLKTEVYNPPNPSVWTNIETAFSQTRFDPTSSGHSKGFSFFVAAQNCGSSTSGLNGTNCNGVYSGIYRGDLTVSDPQSCTFTNGGIIGDLTQTGGMVVLQNNSFVAGDLRVRGGSLYISNSLVGEDLQIKGGGSFSIGPNVAVWGSLKIQNLPVSTDTNTVCATFVWGNLVFQNSGSGIQIGSTSGCPGNIVFGNLAVQNNAGSSVVDGNAVGGNLNDQNNTGASQVFTNAINNNLQCSGNSSITGGGNTAHRKLGQCATF